MFVVLSKNIITVHFLPDDECYNNDKNGNPVDEKDGVEQLKYEI
jgi:hypothetical protein